MSAAPKITSAEIKAAIARKYAAPAWQTCFEVGNATGAAGRTYADAVAMGLWPSNGHELIGFEVKVSRSDWLAEKARPEKALPVMRYCHRWFLVVPKGLVKADEVPATWGLITFDGQKLRETRRAPRLKPEPASPGFMAALVRRAGEGQAKVAEAALSQERAKLRLAFESRVAESVARRIESERSGQAEACAKVNKLEAILGTSLSRFYDDEEFAKCVLMVRDAGITASYNVVSSALNSLRSAEKTLAKALEATNSPKGA